MSFFVKFIYSEKATKFCEISTVDLTVTTVEISQKFVALLLANEHDEVAEKVTSLK